MKQIGRWVLAGLGVVLAGAQAQGGAQPKSMPAVAQAPVPGATGAVASAYVEDQKVLAIRRMTKLSQWKQAKPQFNIAACSSNSRELRNHVLQVTYEIFPARIDNIFVKFFVMVERHGREDKKQYLFYQAELRAVKLARGEHYHCASLLPAVQQRHGDQFIGFAAEIWSATGELLDTMSESAGSELPTDWWKNPEGLKSINAVTCQGLEGH